MKVVVAGLWHLGSTTAACLAAAGHDVVGYDPNAASIASLTRGNAPLFEPGLDALIQAGIASGKLRFTHNPPAAADANVVWITFDTPVDDEDRADTQTVVGAVESLLPHLKDGTLVVVSSQLPVGSVAQLEQQAVRLCPGKRVTFACLPENLRLGQAIERFRNPDRVVAGIRHESDRATITALLAGVGGRIEWMTVESAEMTKHAINAFLATSVTFINEIATICERVGADASEVERGLKTDIRIGPKAYLKPGPAFAGGTLARDVQYLIARGADSSLETHLLSAIIASNARHALWAQRRMVELLGDLRGKRVAVLGLTYKPGTSTLRRSPSLATIRWAAQRGAIVRTYDPAIASPPDEIAGQASLATSIDEAVTDADAVWIATACPEFKAFAIVARALPARAVPMIVLDPMRCVDGELGRDGRWTYHTIGSSR